MKEKLYKFNESDRTVYFATKSGKIITQNKKSKNFREIANCIKKTCKWDKVGYKVFSIKNKQFHVHSIIADLFVKKPNTKKRIEINHIDGNKHNNDYSNLEWVTRSENMKHAYKNNLIKRANFIRENNPNFGNFKDSIEKIASGFWYLDLGHSCADSARFCGIEYKRFFGYRKIRKDLEKRYAK